MLQGNQAPIATHKDGFWTIFFTFLKLGLTAFGGPIAHIGYFRQEFVERKSWLDETAFSQLLAICQFIPGPASSQLGFAIGLMRAGWLGAIAAFTAFTLPSAIILIAFGSALPFLSGDLFNASIHGLKLVACAVVADAVWGMSKNLCTDIQRRGIALAAMSALLIFDISWLQIALIVFGAFAGMVLCKSAVNQGANTIKINYGKGTSLILLLVFTALLLVLVFAPIQSGLWQVAEIFYRAGALVFGGGHVVLPLLEQSIVANGLVSEAHFLAGYGASQAIPGPMFTFAAYLGVIIPTGFSPWLGAIVALLFMFLPGFLLLAAALPVWQSMAQKPKMAQAIAGINATVVGILAAALVDPILSSSISSLIDIVIALIALAMLTVWRLSPLWLVLWCVTASAMMTLL
ncbi:MAG: chromate efflux transporter [Cognaticolwellia sp.]